MKLNSAPVFMHFPEKGKPKKLDTMDLQRKGFGADAIANFIKDRTEVNIRVFRPPNYQGTILFVTIMAMASLMQAFFFDTFMVAAVVGHYRTVERVFFPNICGLSLLLVFWLKWAGYLAVAGLNLLAQISSRISPVGV